MNINENETENSSDEMRSQAAILLQKLSEDSWRKYKTEAFDEFLKISGVKLSETQMEVFKTVYVSGFVAGTMTITATVAARLPQLLSKIEDIKNSLN